MTKKFYVYILATRKRGPIYVGVTSNLPRRVGEHKAHAAEGYTKRYNVDRLVWFEQHENAEAAIQKEKRLKRWRRDWKNEMIEKDNPDWRDLFEELGPE